MATTKTLKDFRFGIEIELFGLSYSGAAAAVAKALVIVTGEGRHSGRCAIMADGRVWNVVYDGSISSGVEVVSPILHYSDLPVVQEVVRQLRKAGGRVNSQCGIHIHVDGAAFIAKPKALANLCKLTNQQEDLMFRAFGTSSSRQHGGCGCAAMNTEFVRLLERTRGRSLSAIRKAWYTASGTSGRSNYDGSRYRGLNLHALFTKGTVEFRYFDSTLHAGKVKAYVQFVLALAAKGYNARASRASKRKPNANVKYAFRTFMLRLGLSGDEFKTCRLHLMKDLPGTQNGLPVNGRPAGYASASEGS